MERVETNLYVDERGNFHGRIRVYGKLHKKAFRTHSIREARQALAQFQTAIRLTGANQTPSAVKAGSAAEDSTSCHNTAVMETIGHLRAQIMELQAHVTETKPSGLTNPVQSSVSEAAPSSPTDRPPLKEALEKYDGVLESTCKDASTYRMYHGEKQNVLRFCGSWEEFDPPIVWGKRRIELRGYHERKRERSGQQGQIPDTAGGTSLNHLRVYLNKFIHWCIARNWLEPAFIVCMRDIKTIAVLPQKVNIPAPEVMDEFFATAESVDFQLGRFLRVTYLLGCRKMSTLDLRWEDVDFNDQLVTLRLKRDREETVPLFPEAATALLEIRPTNYSPKDRIFPLSDRRYKQALQLVKTVVKSMGIGDTKIGAVKSLRSAMISNLLELGYTPPEVAHIVCHQDGGVLVQRVYGKVRQGHLRQKVARTRVLKTGSAPELDGATADER